MDLITHRQAAELMRKNEAVLRRRKDGVWLFCPDTLPRRQDAPGCTIWLNRADVERWIENQNQVFADAERLRLAPIPLDEIRAVASKGWKRTAQIIASLGT